MAPPGVMAAKRAGTAGVEAVEVLELCVTCPSSVLRTLLDCMTSGVVTASLPILAARLAAALDPDGAGERGVLPVYNDLMESPGVVSRARVRASAWAQLTQRENAFCRADGRQCDARTSSSLSVVCPHRIDVLRVSARYP
jgi:hypothetical protein